MRAAMKFDSMTGSMHVRRFQGDTFIDSDAKIVPIDQLRRIGDADIDLFILEAMTNPGREIRMPKLNRGVNHRGGLRRAA